MWYVQSLDQKDPLEKEMATCSSIHSWKISWTEEPGGLVPFILHLNFLSLSLLSYISRGEMS